MNRAQILVVVSLVLLGGSIFFFGKKTVLTQEVSVDAVESTQGMSVEVLLDIAKSSLKEEEKSNLEPISLALDTVQQPNQRAALHKSLSAFWDTKGNWGASAVHFEYAADIDKQATSYMVAGSRYQAAAEMASDTMLSSFLFRKAIETMGKAVEIEPDNLDMIADLANANVVGTPQPMRGIQQLLDIVTREPRHLKANVYLARLAITSGQHDKAVERFTSIIEWYPAYAEAYLGLGEAYYNLGNTAMAVQNLEQYKGLVRDESVLAQVDMFIDQIKSSTP
jgi:tetratricopeptide (TPR) repeat protein